METYRYVDSIREVERQIQQDEAPGVATTAAMQILHSKAIAVSNRPSHGWVEEGHCKALNTLLRAFLHLNRSGVASGWWL